MSGPIKAYSPQEKERLKKRLTNFYLKNARDNMAAVEKALTMSLTETELFEKITVKYGSSVEKEAEEAKAAGVYPSAAASSGGGAGQQQAPSAASPSTTSGNVSASPSGTQAPPNALKNLPEAEKSRVRTRLTNFYKKSAPDNMAAVEKALTMSLTEPELFEKIVGKYGSSVPQEAEEAKAAGVYPGGSSGQQPTPSSQSSTTLPPPSNTQPQSTPPPSSTEQQPATQQPQQQQQPQQSQAPPAQQQQQPSPTAQTLPTPQQQPSTTTATTSGTPINALSDSEKSRLKQRLTNFYTKYAPANMAAVDKALAMGLTETELFEKITGKYGSSVPQEAEEAKAAGVYPASAVGNNASSSSFAPMSTPAQPPQQRDPTPPTQSATAPTTSNSNINDNTNNTQQPQLAATTTTSAILNGPIKEYPDSEKSRLRTRLTNFYTKNAPDNMSAVEKALAMGITETELFERITGKYGSSVPQEAEEAKAAGVYPASSSSSRSIDNNNSNNAPPAADIPLKDYSPSEKSRLRQRLTNFYTKNAPDNMSAIDKALNMGIGETELFERITGKYGSSVEKEAAEAKAAGLYPQSRSSSSSQQQQQQQTQQSAMISEAAKAAAGARDLEAQPSDLSTSLQEQHSRAVTELAVCDYSASEKARFKQRLTQFYSKYHPSGLESVEKAAAMKFTEEVIVGKVCGKYNVNEKIEHEEARKANLLPGSSNIRDLIGADKDRARSRLELFYSLHNPAGVQQGVDDAMRMDKSEQTVFDILCTRYKVSPAVEASVANLRGLTPGWSATFGEKPDASSVPEPVVKAVVSSGKTYLRDLSGDEKNRVRTRLTNFFKKHPSKGDDPAVDKAVNLEMTEAELMLRLCANHGVPVHVEATESHRNKLLPSPYQSNNNNNNNNKPSSSPTFVDDPKKVSDSGFGAEPVTKDPFDKTADVDEKSGKYKTTRELTDSNNNNDSSAAAGDGDKKNVTAEQESALATSVFAGSVQGENNNNNNKNRGPGEAIESSTEVPLASQMQGQAIVNAIVQLPPRTDRLMLQNARPPYPEQFAEALLADLRSLVVSMGCSWVEYVPATRADGMGVGVRIAFGTPMAAASFVNWVRTSVPGGGSGHGGCSFTAPKSRLVYQGMGGRTTDFPCGFITDPKVDPASISDENSNNNKDFSPPNADEGDQPSQANNKKPFHPSQASINQEVFEVLKLSSSAGSATPIAQIEAQSRQTLENNDNSVKKTNVFAVTGKQANEGLTTSGSISSAFPSAATMNVADSSIHHQHHHNNNNNNSTQLQQQHNNTNLYVTPPRGSFLQQQQQQDTTTSSSRPATAALTTESLLPSSQNNNSSGFGGGASYRDDGSDKYSQSEKDKAMKSARDYLMAAGNELSHRLEEVAKSEKEALKRASELDQKEAAINKKILEIQEKEDGCASRQRKLELFEKDLEERESDIRKQQHKLETAQQQLADDQQRFSNNMNSNTNTNNNYPATTSTNSVGVATAPTSTNTAETSVTPINTSSTGVDASPSTTESGSNTTQQQTKTQVSASGTSPMPGPTLRAKGTSPLPSRPNRTSGTSPAFPPATTRSNATGITPVDSELFAHDRADEASKQEYIRSVEDQLREATNTIHELQMVIGDRDQAARALASETKHHAAQVEDLKSRSSRIEQAEVAVRQREERCMQREKEVGRMMEQLAQQKKTVDSTQAKQLQEATTGLAVGVGMSPGRNNNISFAADQQQQQSSSMTMTSPYNNNRNLNNNSNNSGRVSSVGNVAGRLYPSNNNNNNSSSYQYHQDPNAVFGGPRAAGTSTSNNNNNTTPNNSTAQGGAYGSSSPRRALADDEIAALVRRVQDREVALRRVIDDEHVKRMGNYGGGNNSSRRY